MITSRPSHRSLRVRPNGVRTSAPTLSIPTVVGGLVAGAWLLRNSLLTYHVPAGHVTAACSLLLVLGALVVWTHPPRVQGFGWLVLAAALPGVVLAEELESILPRYLGWALLASLVGPMFHSHPLQQLRHGAWTIAREALAMIALGSAVWGVLGLPVLGRGDFTGVMNHANLLAPLAGLSALFFLSAWTGGARWPALAAAGAAAGGMVAASARMALVAFFATVMLLVAVHWRRSARAPVVLAGLSLLGLGMASLHQWQAVGLTSALQQKGLQNTRGHLWNARWQEFRTHPLFGVGVGNGEGEGVEQDAVGRVHVEPGSSYLAVLSMTGIAGAVACMLALGPVVRLAWRHRHHLCQPVLAEPTLCGAFLLVHALGEGWLLAVGSPLAFLFWLTFGRLSDLFSISPPPRAPNRGTSANPNRLRNPKAATPKTTETPTKT